MTNNQSSHRWSLRRRMILAFGLTFFLVFAMSETIHVFGLPYTSFHGLLAEQQQEAMDHLASMASARKKELERWIEDRRTDIMIAGENPSLQQDVKTLVRSQTSEQGLAATTRLRQQFDNIVQGYHGEYDTIELIDARKGIVLISTTPGEEGKSLAPTHYYKEATNPAVDEVVIAAAHEDTTHPDLVFCRGVQSPGMGGENEILAVLVFHNPMQNIIDNLLHQDIGQTGEILLIDQDRRLVPPLRYPLPGDKLALPHVFINTAEPATLASQGVETQLIAKDYRGVEVLAATRHLRVTSELGWGMVVKMDQAEVLAPITRSFFFHIYVALGGLFFGVGIIHLLLSYFTRPLADLNRAAIALQNGDFTVRVSPTGSREIWEVGQAFNAMAQRIESWHAELTRAVEERTHELTETNRSLLESEARFRSLFENIHVTTLLIDPDTGAIIDANDAAASFYGWSKAQLRSMNIAEINTFSPEKVKANMATTLAQGQAYFLFQHRLADGSIKDVEVYAGQIQMADKSILCSIVHDVTQRKLDEKNRAQLEEQLRQSAKMEAVGRLAGGVAHDFNNMLSVILGYLGFLKEDFSANSEVMHSLTEIEKAAIRSKDITRQLLSFSRKQTIAPKPVDVNEAITETQKNLGRLMGEDIEFIFRPGANLGKILIDPSQIDQVLMNLAVNSRDAMPNGGKFIIETENRLLDAEYQRAHLEATPGPYVMLTVSDTGVGMDQDTTNHIFEPFFTTKEVGKGTGLGLATVFGIVQQNKGFINVYSEPGQGTTFRIYLPQLVEDATAGPAEEEQEPVTKGRGTILLVEDEEQVRIMTKRMLEGLGYNIVAAASPQEALSLCRAMTTAPDLLLTDVIMPGMSGRKLCDTLTAKWPTITTIFMSGYTADLLTPHQVLATGSHFLQKPFIRKELARKIKEAMIGKDSF